MEFGICDLSVVAVRSKPLHTAELTTQLIFGETYRVIEGGSGWLKIQLTDDGYEGWINARHHRAISSKVFIALSKAPKAISAELVQIITDQNISFPILIGSLLHNFDGMNFYIENEKFVYAGQAIMQNSNTQAGEFVKRIATKFLHAPYLWGGKTPFGIDCSGFTQTVLKVCGIQLPRDAYQQAEGGLSISFMEEAKEGDLAFFSEESESITHVGIILKEGKIIHASGKVRIDSIDHYGIYNHDIKKYTHKLRIIKRFL